MIIEAQTICILTGWKMIQDNCTPCWLWKGRKGENIMRETVLITGASGGIGKEFACVFAEHGFDLVLAARTEKKLQSLADDLHKRFGVSVTVIPSDLSKADGAETLYKKVCELGIKVDQLVNNAGVGKKGRVVDSDLQTLIDIMTLNISSVTLLCRLFGADMVKRGYGKILNVSSLGAFIPDPGFNVYGPSKAFELFLTEAMEGELHGTGVSVSALCPGPTKTGWAANAGKADSKTAGNPRKVAEIGFRKMQKGRLVIIPSMLFRAEKAAVSLLPVKLRIRCIARWQSGLMNKKS